MNKTNIYIYLDFGRNKPHKNKSIVIKIQTTRELLLEKEIMKIEDLISFWWDANQEVELCGNKGETKFFKEREVRIYLL